MWAEIVCEKKRRATPWMYEDGEGVLKNLTQAKHWMQKVYDGDDKEAAARAEKAWEAFELWKY